MTITERPGVVEVVAKAVGHDEGAARFIVEALLYEALCEETDRIRPALEKDARAIIGKQAADGLEVLAKRYPMASETERVELAKRAEQLYEVLEFGKADKPYHGDDPDERDRYGRFARKVTDALKLFTKPPDIGQNNKDALHEMANGDRYSRARTIGAALGKLPNENAQSVGALARVVGDIGPEAERVFGRSLTRLAYRYRGTERRPDEQMALQAKIIAERAPQELRIPNTTPDQRRLIALADYGALALRQAVPDQKLAELSLEAGRMPPSRGLMFDADGNVVTEAMGFNGDHYLPFDLKNLKRLRGGSYVRTRTTGGLTDEDIYTGILSGARQVSVISNSGVFTIEFDPSLRGGRRYSDKARQMVDRYAKLTAKIGAGADAPYAQDLSPQQKAEIRNKAFERARGNKEMARTFQAEMEEAERFRSVFTTRDEVELMDAAASQARSELAGKPAGTAVLAQRTKAIFNSLLDTERSKAVRQYRLDADGYEAAQKALQQEFPYYIRATRKETLYEFLDRKNAIKPGDPMPGRGGKDMGYTPRGGLMPAGREAASARSESSAAPKRTEGGRQQEAAVDPRSARPTASDLLTQPDSNRLREDFGDALNRSLALAKELNIRVQEAEVSTSDSDADALTYDAGAWAEWAFANKNGGAGVAAFLMDPKTDMRHLDRARDALAKAKRAWQDEGGEQRYPDFNGFDEAIEALETVRVLKKPFADPVDDPALASPSLEQPAPQPFPELEEIGFDIPGLLDYARNHPDIADEARVLLTKDDKQVARAIRDEVKQLETLHTWPKDAAGALDPMHGSGEQYDAARVYHSDRTAMPEFQALENTQKGWALARMLKVAAARRREPVPKIPEAPAPKATGGQEPPKKELGKRAQRSPLPPRIHGPGSPAARALAKRLLSPNQARQPASR